MRRVCGVVVLIGILLIGLAAVLAQDTGDTSPAEAQPTPLPEDLDGIAQQVKQAGEEARNEFDRAINILGIFEGVGLIVSVLSIVGTILAVAGGVAGFQGLNSARAKVEETQENVTNELEEAKQRVQQELDQALQRFSEEMKSRQAELVAIREDLQRIVEDQREKAARANLAMSFMPLGERQYRSQDFSGAIDTYSRALELDPSNLIACYRVGYVYTQAGLLDDAQKYLNMALEIEPDFAPALAGLGYVYRRIGEKMQPGAERNQRLPMGFSVYLKIDGQIADQPLISNEQYIAGGMESVRGYKESEAVGDNAVHATFEVLFPDIVSGFGLKDRLVANPYVFYDGAALQVIEPLPGQDEHETLQGVGAGLRGFVLKKIEYRLDWGYALERTDRTEDGTGRFYFRVKYGF